MEKLALIKVDKEPSVSSKPPLPPSPSPPPERETRLSREYKSEDLLFGDYQSVIEFLQAAKGNNEVYSQPQSQSTHSIDYDTTLLSGNPRESGAV